MKILCTADIHAHEFKDFSNNMLVDWCAKTQRFMESNRGTLVNSRLVDTLNTLLSMRDFCVANCVKQVVIAGDLFHKRGVISTVVYNMTYRVIASFGKFGVDVLLIPGNHDQVSNVKNPENSLYALGEVCNVVSNNSIVTLKSPEETVDLVCVPYSKDKKAMVEYINSYEVREGICSVLVTHAGVSGSFVGSTSYSLKEELEAEDLRYGDFKYVVLGHYHKAQMVKGTNNMFYCGAPLQHNFNDEGDNRGFWVIDTSKRFDARFYTVDSPRFITITASDKLDSRELEGNFVRVVAEPREIKKVVEALQDMNSDQKIRVEVQKSFDSVARSGIKVGMSVKQIVMEYSKGESEDITKIGLGIVEEANL